MTDDISQVDGPQGGEDPATDDARPEDVAEAPPEEAGSVTEFTISADELPARILELIEEGNARRVLVKNEAGDVVVEIPLTVGLVGIMFIPVWTAIGVAAALLTNCTISIERKT